MHIEKEREKGWREEGARERETCESVRESKKEMFVYMQTERGGKRCVYMERNVFIYTDRQRDMFCAVLGP